MNDGTRTHDDRNHNPGLYQLSYAHHNLPEMAIQYGQLYGTPDRTRTCNLRLSLPATVFTAPATMRFGFQFVAGFQIHTCYQVCGLDYIFTISGGTRIVSTDPRRSPVNAPPAGFLGIAIACESLDSLAALRFHRYSALHFTGCYSP